MVALDASFHLFKRIRLATITVDLRQSGDARTHFVTQHVAVDLTSVLFVMSICMWSRSDERHGAVEDIEELRQFVQRRLSQDRTNPSDACVVLRRLRDGVTVFADLSFLDSLLALQTASSSRHLSKASLRFSFSVVSFSW